MNVCLIFGFGLIMVSGLGAIPHWGQRRPFGNHYMIPMEKNQDPRKLTYVQGYPVENQPRFNNLPSVEIQQITAEWMCSNLGTGTVKFFGIRNIKETNMSPEDVEKLLNQNSEKLQENQENFHETTPHDLLVEMTSPAKKPNTNGEGLIDIRTKD